MLQAMLRYNLLDKDITKYLQSLAETYKPEVTFSFKRPFVKSDGEEIYKLVCSTEEIYVIESSPRTKYKKRSFSSISLLDKCRMFDLLFNKKDVNR